MKIEVTIQETLMEFLERRLKVQQLITKAGKAFLPMDA